MSNCYECKHRLNFRRHYGPTVHRCALTEGRDPVSGRYTYDLCGWVRSHGPCKFSPVQPKPTLIQRLKEVFS